MRVIDYINQADPIRVEEIYNEEYPGSNPSGWAAPETFEKFKSYLNSLHAIENDEASVCIKYNQEEGWYNVNHLYDDDEYAADLTEWELWVAMGVHDQTDKELDVDQIATHIYWEMTFHGWPDSMKKTKEELLHRIETLDLDKCIPIEEFLEKFKKDFPNE